MDKFYQLLEKEFSAETFIVSRRGGGTFEVEDNSHRIYIDWRTPKRLLVYEINQASKHARYSLLKFCDSPEEAIHIIKEHQALK